MAFIKNISGLNANADAYTIFEEVRNPLLAKNAHLISQEGARKELLGIITLLSCNTPVEEIFEEVRTLLLPCPRPPKRVHWQEATTKDCRPMKRARCAESSGCPTKEIRFPTHEREFLCNANFVALS
jgi:hypothetical protein